MALSEDVSRIAAVAAEHASPGERIAAVLPVETAVGERDNVTSLERHLHHTAEKAIRVPVSPVDVDAIDCNSG